MENGRQLKIQSELARERRSEGGIEGVGTERARRGIGVNVTHAGNGGKRQKETDCRQNFTTVRATIPHSPHRGK